MLTVAHILILAAGQDSVVVESPLPGGISTVVRYIFSVPQGLQIGGALAGVVVAAILAVVVWRRRTALVRWLATRSRGLKIAMAAAGTLMLLAAAGTGAFSWNYMQHDNGFCTGCHVMGPAYQRFTVSEHDTLQCHDCHQQSIFASMRQLYSWVAERPADIGDHAKVANNICERCHVLGPRSKEVWQRIASTAGHRAHLESDSSALREITCVTCHGLEVHRFVPVDSTCGQANCHLNQDIALGKMQRQTSLHCVTCHQFTAEVPLLASRDSAAGTLVPTLKQCFSCHEMREALAGFDPARDPHRGTCGMCHNPHEQEVARDASQTCATAGCHADWRAEPFHVGPRHANTASRCLMCHEPHRARVDASDCTGCHQAVIGRPGVPPEVRRRLQRAVPFDTSAAIRRGAAEPAPSHDVGAWLFSRDAPDDDDGAPGGIVYAAPATIPPVPADTFEHRKHEELSCLVCHVTSGGHGRLTFEPPRGCQICHHQNPDIADCASCHTSGKFDTVRVVTVSVQVEGHDGRPRPVSFRHEVHRDVRCVSCHVEPVTLAPAAPAAECRDCHDDHHTAARACANCHEGGEVRVAHTPPIEAHRACDACHTELTVSRLVPDRSFCLTCHTPQADHYEDRDCTRCHMLSSPEQYRPALRRTGQ